MTPEQALEILNKEADKRGLDPKEVEALVSGQDLTKILGDKKGMEVLTKFSASLDEGKDFDEIAKDMGLKPFELRRALRPSKNMAAQMLHNLIARNFVLAMVAQNKAFEILETADVNGRGATPMTSLIVNIMRGIGLWDKTIPSVPDKKLPVDEMKKEVKEIFKELQPELDAESGGFFRDPDELN